ncbi:MAG: hypothetical protein GX163_07870 [Bacteroidetes bacterium]|jgi:hypothetical protein|nr:hypothetical protein [Bacteroidota bacterium]
MSNGTKMSILKKGIKKLAISLPLMFLGPYLITLSFLNKDNIMLYVFLALGLTVAISAVYFAFSGINTIVESVFGKKVK